MALEVRWTKRADQKCDNIIAYLDCEWGEKSTRKFVKRVFEVLGILTEFAEIESWENRRKSIR